MKTLLLILMLSTFGCATGQNNYVLIKSKSCKLDSVDKKDGSIFKCEKH